MQQRDFIKDQIEQLGRVLAKILSDFLGLKSDGNVSLHIDNVEKKLKGQLDIDMNELLDLQPAKTKSYLVNKGFHPDHFESLSKLLEEIGLQLKKSEPEKANKYLIKSVLMLDIIDEISETFSMERSNRKEAIKKFL